jgi:hypothetical protein
MAKGRFTTTLSGPELARAVSAGVVTHWHRWRRFVLDWLLRPYGEALWKERVKLEAAENPFLAHLVKAMLARLHGKFAQRASRWELRPDMHAAEAFSEWWVRSATSGITRRYRAVGWDVQEEIDAGDAPHCFPAISAWVTSYAREWLRGWMQIAGRRNVLYVATDSLIVTQEGRENLEKAGIIGDYGIGSLRVVQTSENVAIAGIANLRIGSKKCHGGKCFAVNESMVGDDRLNQLDSLETVLFVRHGQAIQARSSRENGPQFSRWEKIGPGGWLEETWINQRLTTLAPAQ